MGHMGGGGVMKDRKFICPYCNEIADYIDSCEYYSNGRSYGMMYICWPCDATVGVHEGTDNPKGTLAKKELRELRKQVHALFDPMWRDGEMKRGKAYRLLSEEMGIPIEQAHIGEFREADCRKAVKALSKLCAK